MVEKVIQLMVMAGVVEEGVRDKRELLQDRVLRVPFQVTVGTVYNGLLALVRIMGEAEVVELIVMVIRQVVVKVVVVLHQVTMGLVNRVVSTRGEVERELVERVGLA